MSSYQRWSLGVVLVVLAFVAGERVGEYRVRARQREAAAHSGSCCGPARPAGTAVGKPPAIPGPSGRPCLAEFGSDECEACRRLAPVLQTIAATLRGRVEVVSVDTDDHPGEAARWRLRLIPTQILVDPRGKELWRHEGYLSVEELRTQIEQALPSKG